MNPNTTPETPHGLIEEAAELARQPKAVPRPGPLGKTNAALSNMASRLIIQAAADAVVTSGELDEDGVRVA